jgi:hypothetical protein
VLADPLPDREDRVFVDKSGRAVTYGAFSIRLGRHKNGGDRGGFAILVQHGGGSELVSLSTIYDDQATINQVLGLPERPLYGLLWSIWYTAKSADEVARQETRAEWSQAFVNNRIRKSRVTVAGTRKVWIEPHPVAPAAAGPLL